MFYETAQNYQRNFLQFTPYAIAANREAYESLSPKIRETAIANAEKYLHFSYPSIPITSFMAFLRTGNRVNFEDLNFSRRYALNALIIGECVEHKGRFMDDILNGIYAICEESAWQLPAHNSYERNKPSYILPDTTEPLLDLFACETGALLATVSYVLRDELDEISPFIAKRIHSELQRRIYEPYLNRHFWWMGNGDEPMCNWTIWCTQNILLSVFLGNDTENIWSDVLKKSCQSIDCFLKDYGEDGCCDEGAQYYRHSALCLFNTLEIINCVTHNAFNYCYKDTRIQNMASYIFKVHIDDKYYINYADCSPVAGRAGAREFLFAKRINNDNMMRFAALDYKHSDNPLLTTEINLYYHLQTLFTADEMSSYDTSLPIVHPDVYFESVGVFGAHDNHLFLAMKAGDNDDSHNHNDTGSFTIYKDGKPLLIDVGVESYTKKTFSAERYSIWTMQSAYHNLPTINHCMQNAGPDYKATNVTYYLSNTISDISMDIAKAYPANANVKSYKRHASLYKSKQIVIEDEIEFKTGDLSDNEFFLSLMFYEKPTLNERSITIGDWTRIEIIGDCILSTETIPITDLRLQQAWKHDIYRVTLLPKVQKFTIIIE